MARMIALDTEVPMTCEVLLSGPGIVLADQHADVVFAANQFSG
jgi:hypothetical protein